MANFVLPIGKKIANNYQMPPKALERLTQAATLESSDLLDLLDSNIEIGLHSYEARDRLKEYGPNEAVVERKQNWIKKLFKAFYNPLVILLLGLSVVSLFIKDMKSAYMMIIMVILGVSLKFFQELKADRAVEALKAMVQTTSTVIREGKPEEITLSNLVPGDIIKLSAGDIVPADVRILQAKDLFLNQATLTGEALPVEKFPASEKFSTKNPLEFNNICFMGTNIESGTALAVVATTGFDTFFGNLAKSVSQSEQKTNFDKGISQVTWLMIGFMAFLVPLVFLVNFFGKGNWLEAFLFSVSVAVGLTPEMLPMIVTVNLSNGAIAMSRKHVIVKKLGSIQNLGAMDVLCTDKTGTITQGRVVLEQHLDVDGEDSDEVLEYGFLNSYHQTGLKSILDQAVLEHTEIEEKLHVKENFKKVDEIPFDFVRRRMSVVVEDASGKQIIICKGAVEEIFSVCTQIQTQGVVEKLGLEHMQKAKELVEWSNSNGFRALGLAYREMPEHQEVYCVSDEREMTLLGFLTFLDPPKVTAKQAIKDLRDLGVSVKILTGDNDLVSKKICSQVGLETGSIVLGSQLEEMDESQLIEIVEKTNVFAKLAPSHKERIITILKKKGHVVGFMGDGINDAPALKAADVGISVDTAVDIAKESSDIILLGESLTVLQDGLIEGRRVFGNIIKYIKMAASSNFGNMFSILGASFFIPFLPLLPIQILTNNLLYDFSQTAIPTDRVDEEWIQKPRKWTIGSIRQFIIFIGPISSIFDYLTFFVMIFVFGGLGKPELFRTGWFVESLLTQTLIIHVIRTNKVPFLQSRASLPLTITSIVIALAGIYLPYSPLAGALGLVGLPPLYWPIVFAMLVCYIVLTQAVKTWFIKRYPEQ
ncbi:MAG: magnesium-translocating P-type ATPase [Caldisericia bacterium]|nr:magnesium-translocating P-type ATPase [Caldisericia bacterium]